MRSQNTRDFTLEDLINGVAAPGGAINRNRDLMDRGLELHVPPTKPGTPVPDPQGMGRDVRISQASGIPMENFQAATEDLKLTPQEQALYQRHLENLHGPGGVDNADGSRSSLYQLSFQDLQDPAKPTYNIPTVHEGKILDPDSAIAKARAEGLHNYPSYPSEQEAEARYQAMHDYMDRDTQDFLRNRPAPPSQYMFEE